MSADRIPGGYVVRDANGQALAYIYSRDNEDEARQAKVLTKDEARRIAVNVARLPVRQHVSATGLGGLRPGVIASSLRARSVTRWRALPCKQDDTRPPG
jgi:K+/H+ antiporter YhaU regulatory subunit KhtT